MSCENRPLTQAVLDVVTKRLLNMGYEEDGVSPEGLGHRYRNEVTPAASVDVLLPEGIRDPNRFPTATGARTIEVPGSAQALERSLRPDGDNQRDRRFDHPTRRLRRDGPQSCRPSG